MSTLSKSRKTRQLEVVWEAVAVEKGHPTAEMVFQRARKRLPKISVGTVYRNLQKLVRQERLVIVRAPDGVLRFDARTDRHDHFVCQRCGDMTDVPTSSGLDEAGLEKMGYRVVNRQVTWVGFCPRCTFAGARLLTE